MKLVFLPREFSVGRTFVTTFLMTMFLIYLKEDVDAGRETTVMACIGNAQKEWTYYAKPPQMPSILINRNTRPKANPSELSGITPTPDSKARVTNITSCTIAGRGSKRDGKGGRPKEIDDRDKKTVAW